LSKQRLLNRRVGYVAIAVAAILFIVTSYVHEFGHALICSMEGKSVVFQIKNGLASAVTCEGIGQNMLYWSFGGILGMLAALTPLVAWRWVLRNRGVIVGSLTMSVTHGVTGIIETFAHEWYVLNTSDASIVVGAATGLAFTAFFILFGRK
jgi:hypothetical protein